MVLDPTGDLLALLADVVTACAGANRADLAQRMASRRALVADPSVAVVVAGEFKTGKSSLVNAVVGVDVLPVHEDIATAVPTFVRYAPETTVWVRRVVTASADDAETAEASVSVTQRVSVDVLPSYVSERSALPPPPGGPVRAVIVGLPSPLLAEGLVLVDTPGVGGLASQYTVATLASLSMAHAAVFVSEATQEYTKPELDFLSAARRACPAIIPVLTKIDMVPEWRKIERLDQGWLDRAGVTSQIVSTSSALALLGRHQQRRDLAEESRIDDLVDRLRDVLRDGRGIVASGAVVEVHGVIAQLAAPVRAERDAIEHPAAVLGELERAEEVGSRLVSDRAEWLRILDDGFVDLTERIEVEALAGIRTVAEDARQTVSTTDPAIHWDEFEAALAHQVSSQMSAISTLLLDGTHDIAERIAHHFSEHESTLAPSLEITSATPVSVDAVMAPSAPANREWRGVLMESGWGGIEGVSAIVGIVGFAAINLMNPFVLAATLLVGIGGKTFHQVRKRELERRRQQATEAIEHYLDEASKAADRQWRASLRRIQRELRDAYQKRAEELHHSTRDSLAAARRSWAADERDRPARLGAAGRRLAALQALDDRATSLAPAPTPASPRPEPATPWSLP